MERVFRRCDIEGVRLSAWSGLVLSVNRFSTSVPAELIDQLKPSKTELSVQFSFTTEPLFYWNCSSIAGLLLNAAFSGDRQRKLSVLWRSLLPNDDFLRSYYGRGDQINWFSRVYLTIIHWLVLILPGAAVRRSFGEREWQNQVSMLVSPATIRLHSQQVTLKNKRTSAFAMSFSLISYR